jgi:hypothetical protein
MCTKFLVGKPEGQKPIERARCRWCECYEIDLKETELKSVDWIQQAQNDIAVASSCERGNRTSSFMKGGEFIGYLSEYMIPTEDPDQVYYYYYYVLK